MSKISEEMGKHPEVITKVYSNLDKFEPDQSKALVIVFDELLKLDVDPHPLSEKLSTHGNDFTNDLVSNLETETSESNYAALWKAVTYQPELHSCMLRKEICKKLADNMTSSDAHVAMNSSDVLEHILVSDTHQDIISRYVGEDYEAIMEVLRTLIGKLPLQLIYF